MKSPVTALSTNQPMDGQTDKRTDGRKDKPFYRDAILHLRTKKKEMHRERQILGRLQKSHLHIVVTDK